MPKVRLFAQAREAAGTGRADLPGATVADVLQAARTRYGVAFAEHNSSIWLSIGRSVGKGSMLDDGLFK